MAVAINIVKEFVEDKFMGEAKRREFVDNGDRFDVKVKLYNKGDELEFKNQVSCGMNVVGTLTALVIGDITNTTVFPMSQVERYSFKKL
jgi:hypothetical protein